MKEYSYTTLYGPDGALVREVRGLPSDNEKKVYAALGVTYTTTHECTLGGDLLYRWTYNEDGKFSFGFTYLMDGDFDFFDRDGNLVAKLDVNNARRMLGYHYAKKGTCRLVTPKIKTFLSADPCDALPSSIADATKVMLEQREKGVAKYGVPLEGAGLGINTLVRHAQEEAADLSVYLSTLADGLRNPYGYMLVDRAPHEITTNKDVADRWVRMGQRVRKLYLGEEYRG